MRRFCRFLFLTGLLLGLFLSVACADIIKDFSFTPLDHAVELTFSVKDTEKVVVHYTNSLEKGKLELSSADGHFSGTLSLPATYPGNNVAVTVKTPRGKELLKKTYVQTALEVIPLEEKAASGRLSGVTVCVDPGHQGVAIKKVSTEARKSLEKFFGKKIYLETFVKVDKDWRSSDKELNAFGYNPK
jgi:hypothetical protein